MIGARLKQARLAAGLSMDALAARMDRYLTKQAISKYEMGKSVPSPEALVRIAEALNLKTSYFLQESNVYVKFIAYRKHSRLPKSEQAQLQGRITEHMERYYWLASLFSSAMEPGKPSASRILRPKETNTTEDAERIARDLRAKWDLGLDPIENMTETLEDHDVAVLTLDSDARFDGISAWAVVHGHEKRWIPILVTNAGMPGDRQRFNLAHELGHLVIKPKSPKEDEVAAHRFAAAFLVPAEAAYKELGRSRSRLEFDELLLLKHKYGLSMQAWLRRAKDLGIISPSWYKNTVVIFRKRGWHKCEPSKQVAPEQPMRFKQLMLRAMAEGIVSRERAEELDPGMVSLDTREEELTKAKKIASLPLAERRRLLEAAAERATHDYKTNKELTTFTNLDGAAGD